MAALRERLTPEQADFVKAVDAFCERECPPHKLRAMTANGTVAHDDALYRKLAATGWLGLTIPEEYGGSAGELSDVALLTERLSYHRLPVTGYLTTVITAQALIRFGTEEQKRRVLPAVAQGDVLSIAITEPDTGSDAAAVRTHARRDGDCWRINGEKIYTSNANHARWVLVVTRTNPDAAKHRGISLFLVPMDRVEVTKLDMLGHIDTTITRYADVRATDADIVGGLDAGWRALVQGLNSERMIIGAEAVGVGQRAFDDVLRYAKERHQFGQPIGRFQALQHGLAETATKLLAARLLVRHVAELLDGGDPAPAEASMAKLFATETAKEAALQGMQFMGGMGYSMESDMQSYVRDSLVMTIFGGTSQIQKNIIAGQLGLNG
ncbi:acyl-CoA/acyl-ACP dehydrogenase [Pseudonocardia sp. KRD-184]|uniref:Acyl-CoA/acyl-ACP dehydrogenase n=1 Tax=Pseudonocardia oceani TaxID=2792013 RepID=A0ABS6U2T0_9PSEU|nr:acyl-CoA dehydrogenase family protein [Pseudonocardia oceani]MBW0089998.1 acyl-CoA/acyl-ACP dehydrogenase [Pseudonocardia oceani]MBW0094851.1 acyl-CoA/acyl-ACP dehydrogenase [Pseudonocardia oceani]MBW0108169.1 acyl-CoA/acyl-ACP dehydrogenase [Pseudonocardia oceani]MBW0120550.1 acyl-CoA/acyl-ACP dehydrogenase [Pseudonocardia oceani]MBW0126296.1 acyl-CoA/acyl-ACP dehydrogenase [Pseudonocardia oceani]